MFIDSPQEELKRHNESLVLDLIRQHAPISRAQLTIRTGLSAQTISNIVRRLLETGLVVETGADRNGSIGRQPINLDIHADGSYAIGVSFERDHLIKTLVNLKGDVLHQEFDELQPGELPHVTVQKIKKYVQSVREERFPEITDRLAGIGLGVPGPIDYRTGQIMTPPNMPHWTEVALRDTLQDEIGIPVVLDNNCTVGAIGERWRGKWTSESFLYCYWGVGIGGGFVTNNEIYRGMSGNSIELGHIVVEPKGRACECGGFGCLEGYASILSILRAAKFNGNYTEFQRFVNGATPGTEAFQILTQAAEYMAQALVTAVNILDVDLVILGGRYIPLVEHIFLPVISKYVSERTLRAKVGKVSVVVSTLSEETRAVAAASLVFQELLL